MICKMVSRSQYDLAGELKTTYLIEVTLDNKEVIRREFWDKEVAESYIRGLGGNF